ncbi:MAG: class I SAM-dependent methyltransferase [candidate division KSB1 bacterium]|nr:class I SAM-dependent methyltransferase [candidate division KSB1 bacterium]
MVSPESSRSPRVEIVKPYSQLAWIYDYVMRHVNYVHWANYINQILRSTGIPVRYVVDMACGTGNLAFELHHRNYQVSGFDSCFSMIKVAQEKSRQNRVAIPFWCGDITNFALAKPQDALLCLYDSINYLMSLEECQKVFKNVYSSLKAGGLFILDICTERNSKKNFRDYFEKDSIGDISYTRKSYYSENQRIHFNEFHIKVKSTATEYVELHQQRIYSIDELQTAIRKEPYKILNIFDGFTTKPGSEKSDRVHFVLQKMA